MGVSSLVRPEVRVGGLVSRYLGGVERSTARRLAEGIFRLGTRVKDAVPERIRKRIDDRFFYAVFQLTRVTNDDAVSDEVRRRRQSTDQDRSTSS